MINLEKYKEEILQIGKDFNISIVFAETIAEGLFQVSNSENIQTKCHQTFGAAFKFIILQIEPELDDWESFKFNICFEYDHGLSIEQISNKTLAKILVLHEIAHIIEGFKDNQKGEKEANCWAIKQFLEKYND